MNPSPPPQSPLLRWGPLFLVAMVLMAPFLKLAIFDTWNYVGTDWEIFYGAAIDLREGRSPYPETPGELQSPESPGQGWGGYIYPTFFARALVPLTFLPPLASKRIYLALCLGAYALLVLLPARRLVARISPGETLALAFLLGWGPVFQNFRYGQSNFLPLFGFAAAWFLVARGKPGPDSAAEARPSHRRRLLAGMLIGVGASLKLTPLLMVPLAVVAGQGVFLGGMSLGLGLGVLFSGLDSSREFFFRVLPSLSQLPAHPENLSLATVLDRIASGMELPPQSLHSIGSIATIVLYLAVLGFLFLRGRNLSLDRVILLGALFPAVFTGIWFHHYLPAVLAWSVFLSIWTTQVWGHGRSFLPRLRWIAVLILLLPGFSYWTPTQAIASQVAVAIGLPEPSLFVLGHLAAFLLVLPPLTSPIPSPEVDPLLARAGKSAPLS